MAAPHSGLLHWTVGLGNVSIPNVPSPLVLFVVFLGFLILLVTSDSSVTLLAQGPDTAEGISVVFEAVSASGGTTHEYLPHQPISMMDLLEN